MDSRGHEKIVSARGVGFGYPEGEAAVIEGLTLEMEGGEFVGLLGPNGSGKSTILRLMAGMLMPRVGEIALWGRGLHSYPDRDRAKLISYLPQSLDAGVPFTVSELVAMGLYPYDKVTGIGLAEGLALVGLTEKADAPLSRLSGGERRRAYIAMTLLQGAGLLLMDEPLANLDIRYQMELIRLLRRLNEGRGISILMALHDINLAPLFDRLVLISRGRVVADGPHGEVVREDTLSAAFGTGIRVINTGDGTFVTCV